MIRTLPLGVYVPGDSVLHRAHPTAKFVALLVFIIAVTLLPTRPWHALAALGLSVTAFGIPLVIRAVLRARMIGEALMARGAVD